MQALVVRHHEADTAFLIHPAHHLLGVALQHLDDGRLAPSPLIHAHHPYHGPVAVQQPAHLPRREKQILPPVVRFQKPETVRMANHAAGKQVFPVYPAQPAAPVADQLSVPLHGVEAPSQRLPVIILGQLQLLRHLQKIKGRPVFVQERHDEFPAGDRIRILARLPFPVRIALPRGLLTAFCQFYIHLRG